MDRKQGVPRESTNASPGKTQRLSAEQEGKRRICPDSEFTGPRESKRGQGKKYNARFGCNKVRGESPEGKSHGEMR